MNELEINKNIFESIKHTDGYGNEYWYAKQLMSVLEYTKWERFSNAIYYAIISCQKCGYDIKEHFPRVGKMIKIA